MWKIGLSYKKRKRDTDIIQEKRYVYKRKQTYTTWEKTAAIDLIHTAQKKKVQ